MEFYKPFKFIFNKTKRFQFPTGWNSTRENTDEKLNLVRFNSQRDGILPYIASLALFLPDGFQFPTGWNSTFPEPLYIINFMSFNSQRDGILRGSLGFGAEALKFQFPTGWNSTQTKLLLQLQFLLVSIPNGMEFYISSLLGSSSELGGFNSQRDGILQHEFCHFSR